MTDTDTSVEALRHAAEAVYRSDFKHDAYDEILALITED